MEDTGFSTPPRPATRCALRRLGNFSRSATVTLILTVPFLPPMCISDLQSDMVVFYSIPNISKFYSIPNISKFSSNVCQDHPRSRSRNAACHELSSAPVLSGAYSVSIAADGPVDAVPIVLAI